MKKISTQLNKQNLRRYLGLFASYTEILLALMVIVGILLLCVRVVAELKEMMLGLLNGTAIPSFSEFLTIVFEQSLRAWRLIKNKTAKGAKTAEVHGDSAGMKAATELFAVSAVN